MADRPPEGPQTTGRGITGPTSDAAEQSVDVAGVGIHTRNGGQWPGLRRRGTRVETHAGKVMGGGDRRLGYGRPQARRRTRLEDRPTLRAVVTFDVCCNAAVNCDLSCFLYSQTKAAVFALPGRRSGVTMVISSQRQKHLFPLPPTA